MYFENSFKCTLTFYILNNFILLYVTLKIYFNLQNTLENFLKFVSKHIYITVMFFLSQCWSYKIWGAIKQT